MFAPIGTPYVLPLMTPAPRMFWAIALVGRPFCAVVDLRIPGGPDGTAMRRLLEKYPALPILVETGCALEPPHSAVAVFQKPFGTAELLAEVERQHAAQGGSAA